MTKAISVKSEIGRLEKVLVHRPGGELARIIPEAMGELLFDDIPHLSTAQKDHDSFVEVLRTQGVDVLYMADLAAAALRDNDEAKTLFVSELMDQSDFSEGYKDALVAYFMGLGEDEIVRKAIEGITLNELGYGLFGGGLSRLKSPEAQFILYPMPNLYFQRDPMASIGNGVAISHMHYPVRNRETIFAKYIFRYHPDFKDNTKFYYKKHWPFAIEGGDILNLSDKVLAIGISERTHPSAIDTLAKTIFSDEDATIDTILAMEIPKKHNCMHLDTIFTQIDHNKFLNYENIMLNIPTFYILKKTEHGKFVVEESRRFLGEVLQRYLELDSVNLIPLGGGDSIAAAREQWNAAANTLAVAPGVVICYDRNDITNQSLRDSGVTVLQIPSSELSRGRGGPRCMSMPLIREGVK